MTYYPMHIHEHEKNFGLIAFKSFQLRFEIAQCKLPNQRTCINAIKLQKKLFCGKLNCLLIPKNTHVLNQQTSDYFRIKENFFKFNRLSLYLTHLNGNFYILLEGSI